MNETIRRINFSVLSSGEQKRVYQIIGRAQSCQAVSESDKQFLEDMASRGDKSNVQGFAHYWSDLVSYVGLNTGHFIAEKLRVNFVDRGNLLDFGVYTVLLTLLNENIERVGGTIVKQKFDVPGTMFDMKGVTETNG